MRFLCLHGKGTNSQALEVQLSAVRYQLGDGHTYDFVEGTVTEKAAPEIQALFSRSAQYFGYFDEQSAESCWTALTNLERYIAIQGPFDGLIAFSQGAALASTLLVRQARQIPSATAMKLAIFFSGGIPVDPDLLESGVISPLDPKINGEVITIPTVHIWGDFNSGELQWPPMLLELCRQASRERYQHRGGHEIPGSKDRAATTKTVQLIKRGIWRAERNETANIKGGIR